MKKIAAIQMASGSNVQGNLSEAERLISQAVEAGAGLIVLPENFAHMGVQETDKLEIAEPEGEGVIQSFLADQALQNQIWIVGGTIPISTDRNTHVNAACLVYSDQGEQVARYDKLHLFDVEIHDTQEKYVESETISAGEKLTWFDSPFGRIGLAVCYDVRFPELFRELINQEIEIFAIPSAFTATTGQAHWETLVRARAIENLSYVVAANQGGYHVNGRETHGHSMIVDPWGNILDRLESGPGIVVTEIDRDRLESIRKNFPSLLHRRINSGNSYD
jgi:predicted amidohydrolase